MASLELVAAHNTLTFTTQGVINKPLFLVRLLSEGSVAGGLLGSFRAGAYAHANFSQLKTIGSKAFAFCILAGVRTEGSIARLFIPGKLVNFCTDARAKSSAIRIVAH